MIASPIIYGIIVAYLLTPVVNTIEAKLLTPLFLQKAGMTERKKKWMRVLSVGLTMILFILVIYVFILILIPNIVTSIKSISYQFPYYVKNLTYWANKFLTSNPDIEKIVVQLVNMYSGEFTDYLNNSIIPQLESLVKTVSHSLISVLRVLWDFIIGIIIKKKK